MQNIDGERTSTIVIVIAIAYMCSCLICSSQTAARSDPIRSDPNGEEDDNDVNWMLYTMCICAFV